MSNYFKYLSATALTVIISTTLSACGGDSSKSTSASSAAAPVIAEQPEQVLTVVGQQATFNVKATGEGALSYQWYKNGVAIPSATSANYVTPVLANSDQGSLYSVQVSTSGGSTTSNQAVLKIGTLMPAQQWHNASFTLEIQKYIINAAENLLFYNDVMNGYLYAPDCYYPQEGEWSAVLKLNGVILESYVPALGLGNNQPPKNILEGTFKNCDSPNGQRYTGKINTVHEVIKATPSEYVTQTTSQAIDLNTQLWSGNHSFILNATVVTIETVNIGENNQTTVTRRSTILPGGSIINNQNNIKYIINGGNESSDIKFSLQANINIKKITNFGGAGYTFAILNTPTLDLFNGILFLENFNDRYKIINTGYTSNPYTTPNNISSLYTSSLYKNDSMIMKSVHDEIGSSFIIYSDGFLF